ncbi:MAG: XrtA/PEP-CTERM system exopolysaccharide export protein [Pseudomonadota bacterium]|nr:XrtA/PEP-CTERM system exopolysaccharide export protein [Pseudomonadota bacterium]
MSKSGKINKLSSLLPLFLSPIVLLSAGCSTLPDLPEANTHQSATTDVESYQYLVGPGDRLTIFVWRNPEISGEFIVRPDGKITTSLVEDIQASGKTPSELAREIEEKLSVYITNPRVTVSVNNFAGPLSEQVRVIGEAMNPLAVNYSQNMTLLDLMIAVGGLTEFADGNGAKLIRVVNGKKVTYRLFIDDLIRDGDISQNVDILPGDVVIIPEAWL